MDRPFVPHASGPQRWKRVWSMGIVLQFPSNEERAQRHGAAEMDRARRDWTMLAGYDRQAAASAMTEFYRLWFAAAERQGYFDQARPSDSE